MDDRLRALEADLQSLAARVDHMQRRLDRLDASWHEREPVGEQPAGTITGAGIARGVGVDLRQTPAVMTALGRLLIILGGAYLLRAITDAGAVPTMMGVPVGLVYAVVWLWAAARSERHAQAMDAAFHGAAAVVIAFPLLVEATLRFSILSGTSAAATLSVLSGLFLVASWRARLHSLAWFTMAATIGTGLVLMVQTETILPYAACFVLLGIATLWLGYDREWIWLRWPAALVADALVAGAIGRVTGARVLDPPVLLLAVQGLLLGGYLGSFAIRTLVRGRAVIPFEVLQTAAVLVVGLGGGLAVSRVAGGIAIAGWIAVALAITAYAVAFAFVDRRQGRGANFYFYGTLALVCALSGSSVLPSPFARAVLWSVLAVITTIGGGRLRRMTLSFHGAVYLIGGAIAAGLPAEVWQRVMGPPVAGLLGWPALIVTIAAAIACAVPPSTEPGVHPLYSRLPGVLCAAVMVAGAIGLAAGLSVGAAQWLQGEAVSHGTAATIRTVVLAVGAVLVAWLAARTRLTMLNAVVYPMLALTGLKFLVEDLRQSRPATLFAAFAVYGIALVVAPRIGRRGGGASGQ